MSTSGKDFLELWIDGNVLPKSGDRAQARQMAQKLVIDATVAGFAVADLGIEPGEVEKYILEIMVNLDVPGTPGD